jgi:hypothetical protein
MIAAVFAWVVSLVAAGMLGHAAGQQSAAKPAIVSGDDIGFRITGMTNDGRRQGTLVVRVNGGWVDVELKPEMAIRPVR